MDVSDVHMKTWFVILMLILCVAMPQTLHGQNSQLGIASHSLKVINPVFASFNESSPITINGDADFISQANSSGWDGNGTEVSPFIISGLNITSALIGNPLVDISDTTVHFVLENNLLVGGSVGLSLDTVSNGRISNNTVRASSGYGVYLYQVNSCLVSENDIHENDGIGMLADYSNHSDIRSNTIYENNIAGLYLRDSPNNAIVSNNLSYNQGSGIVFGNSDNCIIYHNLVHHNSGSGLSIGVSDSITVMNNTIYENGDEGVVIASSPTLTNVTMNTFFRNRLWGIRISSCGIVATYNNFIDNTWIHLNPIPIGGDSEISLFSHNYWSDWVSPDVNNDNLVDIPYSISTYISIVDIHPHVYAFVDFNLHILTKPILFYPNVSLDGVFYYGIMDVAWGPSSDTHGHSVSYNVSYSNDAGMTWTSVVTAFEDISYSWDTTTLLQNESYSVMVVAQCSEGLESSDFTNTSFIVREHTLTTPVIIYPTGGETFTNDIPVEWTLVVDSWNHEVTYSIYISMDDGVSWIFVNEWVEASHGEINDEDLTSDQIIIKVVASDSNGLTSEFILDSQIYYNPHLGGVIVMTGVLIISGIIVAVVLYLRRR